MAVKQIYRGDTWARAWLLGTLPTSPAIVSARFQVRDKFDGLVIDASTITGELTLSIDADGSRRIDMLLPPAKTDVRPGDYSFGLDATFADGAVRTLEDDQLRVLKDSAHG